MTCSSNNQPEPAVRSEVIITTTTSDDIKLIISALSAYQHNTQYRDLYERLLRQAGQAGAYDEALGQLAG